MSKLGEIAKTHNLPVQVRRKRHSHPWPSGGEGKRSLGISFVHEIRLLS